MEDINLHFTGDFHAIGAANNLLAAMTDNHIYQGNALGIDPRRITWRRCVDMNDRQLRRIVNGLGGKTGGVPREDGYDITVASEIMAVFCLASSLKDLKKRLSAIVVGYTYDGKPVTAGDLKAQGAMAALKRRVKAESRSDARRNSRVRSRRTVRQHSARLQLRACDESRSRHSRLRGYGSGVWRGSRRGKVFRHKMQTCGVKAFRGRSRGDGARAENARRTR